MVLHNKRCTLERLPLKTVHCHAWVVSINSEADALELIENLGSKWVITNDQHISPLEYIYMCVCVCVCLYVYRYMCVCVFICIYIYVCVCVFICICVLII